MPEDQSKYTEALALIDAANGEDPNREHAQGRDWPKELLYSERMSDMLERFSPDADEAQRLAVRAQHIQRWKSSRDAFPAGRQGYHQWRTGLYKFHAETAGKLLAQAGYGSDVVDRVEKAVGKRALKVNPDTQLIEDIAGLVFIEHYMLAFAEKHPEYDEAKWIDIVQKTWKKLSVPARDFALRKAVRLPEALVPLIQKAITQA